MKTAELLGGIVATKWSRPRNLVVGASLLGLLLAWGMAVTQQAGAAFDPALDKSSICTASSLFDPAEVLAGPSKFVETSVPESNPLPNATALTHRITQGDIIQVRVGTSRAGAVAIHGIMEAHALRKDDFVYVRFQAKYAGRFPMHFHGDDGSHFEVAVFEISGKK